MRITCDHCGKDRMPNEAHTRQGIMLIRDVIARMRHDGCGGRAGRVELLTGIKGVPAGRYGASCHRADEQAENST